MEQISFKDYLAEASPIDIIGKKTLTDIKDALFSDSLKSWVAGLPDKNLKRRLEDVKSNLQILCSGVGIK